MNRFVCIHGHFYQPPRENPWLEEVELQDSAYPYHDWNERITAECYAPNTASRLLDAEQKVIDITNNYSRISFNFGPTLLSWLKRHSPEVYQAILASDEASRERFHGHGAALAQVYNHLIMPLANSRDKRTQIRWGIRDFQHRFHRDPEGMWLAETAVDTETLELLAEQGIRFTILAPNQAKAVRKIGEDAWHDVSGSRIDPRRAYRCALPSGRTIALFFYDGPISQELAFGNLTDKGENLANKLASVFSPDGDQTELAHIATDGETYGHHHRFGDMALAYCLNFIEEQKVARLTVYGDYLEQVAPSYEVEIFENSSWSCAHGVRRWMDDCGCNSGRHGGWSQAWRSPLRGAMDWLRDNLIHIYEAQAALLLKDPWRARDDYIEVLLERTPERIDAFLAAHRTRELSPAERTTALMLLEMQRQAMLMYTSCGWFFDEVTGIETVQIMAYAARAMQLARRVSGIALEEAYKQLLERAPSNLPKMKNAAVAYERFVQPQELDLLRVGVHYAISSVFTDYPAETDLYMYAARTLAHERAELGKQRLSIGRIVLRSKITEEEEEVSFAVLHLGDHNVLGGAREFRGESVFGSMQKEVKQAFLRGEVSEVVRLIDTHFSGHNFSLWHLFKDEQRKIIGQIFAAADREAETFFRQLYEHHGALFQMSETLQTPILKHFMAVITFLYNTDIRYALEAAEPNRERLKRLAEEIERFSLEIDRPALSLIASQRINQSAEALKGAPDDPAVLTRLIELVETLEKLALDLDLWKAQNVYFSLAQERYARIAQQARANDPEAAAWVEQFHRLGECLTIKVV